MSLLDTLVVLASRSPSAHNTQPWSPRVVGDAIEVAVVPGRTLPAGDPTFRDLLLALGGWAEAVAIGAAAHGHGIDVELLPGISDLDQLPVAGPADPSAPVFRIRLTDDPPTTPFTPDDVRERHMHRGRLDPAPGLYDDLSSLDLPPWLSLRPLDGRAMQHLVRLGTSYTFSRRSIADELVGWLRLSPEHPRYELDGMTDRMLAVPKVVARSVAPLTRRRALHDPALAVVGAVARVSEAFGTDKPLPVARTSEAGVTHHVLVANAGADSVLSRTEMMDSLIGVPEPQVFTAGRVLHRLWLHAHVQGAAVAPHSETIDSPTAHAVLRRRLLLGRADIALSVFTVGVPVGPVARSPRLTDGAAK